jgi:Icc-related predicted phosphoesterase
MSLTMVCKLWSETGFSGAKDMRIMAMSDLHGNFEGLDPSGADVVVLAGDIAPLRGRGVWHVNDQKKWINKKFREWTQSYPDVQFVVTPGNHDFFPIAHILFNDQGIDWSFDFSENVHFLGDCGTEIKGVKFYGTPWVPIISYSWAFEGEHDTLKRWFSKIPADIDVLITHSPPYIPGSDVDRSIQTNSEHFGSGELTEAIIDKRPRFVFCGHIHTGQHGGVDFEGSRIYNVSRLDENYEIAYEPTWVEV